jgi:purine-nucleoside phosphorylase
VRTLRWFGAERFLLTNAAGGLARSFVPGDLMVLTDHLNLTGRSPLQGDHEPVLGPRFPDMSEVYDQKLQAALLAADLELQRGVYAGLPGPSYETPAEIKMLATLGADAVGMSTVLEAIALRAMGARVAGLSLIANAAAGISPAPLSHDEVIAAGRGAERRIVELLVRAVPMMAKA